MLRTTAAKTWLGPAMGAAALLLLLAAAPAAASPTITRLDVELPVADEPATLIVEARDPSAPVSGVTVVRPGAGSAGASACRIGARAGRSARFEIPLPGDPASALGLRVTVTSGGCHGRGRSVVRDLAVEPPAITPPGAEPEGPGLFPLPGGLPLVARSAATRCRGADQIPRRRTRGLVRKAVICLINVQRRLRGLPVLRSHKRLQRAAFAHSVDMRKRRYFHHVGPDGRPEFADRLRRARYWPASAAENIGAGTDYLATPSAIVDAWMRSPGHRANLLAPGWRHIGVGVVTGYPAPPASPGGTYTAVFGRR